MLAFNLGIFFRNLHGEEVIFSAENSQCSVQFTGGVETLAEKSELNRELNVVLTRGELACRISIDEEEDPETEDNPEVRVVMTRGGNGKEGEQLLQTTFHFNEIKLQHSRPDEEPQPEPQPEPLRN